MIEGQGLFGCELEPNLTQMDLETVAAPKCGFRLISSWGRSLPSRTTDMQEIVGCRGLQRPEGAHVAVPLEIGSNCLINQCLTTQTHSMESCDGNRSSGTIPDSVKLAKRFNAAEQFRRALLNLGHSARVGRNVFGVGIIPTVHQKFRNFRTLRAFHWFRPVFVHRTRHAPRHIRASAVQTASTSISGTALGMGLRLPISGRRRFYRFHMTKAAHFCLF